jgi:hypothetical protein
MCSRPPRSLRNATDVMDEFIHALASTFTVGPSALALSEWFTCSAPAATASSAR